MTEKISLSQSVDVLYDLVLDAKEFGHNSPETRTCQAEHGLKCTVAKSYETLLVASDFYAPEVTSLYLFR
jgi:hypothetical protein